MKTKYRVALIVGSVVAVFLFFNSAGVFFEHWSDIDVEYVAAQEYLKSPVCLDEAMKARVGEYAEGCKRAKAFTQVFPIWRALFRTITEWYLCRGPGCTAMARAILDSAWNLVIMGLLLLVVILYITGHRGSTMLLSHGTLPLTYQRQELSYPRQEVPYLCDRRRNVDDID